jgi:polysaccharide biosynthesis/export protein
MCVMTRMSSRFTELYGKEVAVMNIWKVRIPGTGHKDEPYKLIALTLCFAIVFCVAHAQIQPQAPAERAKVNLVITSPTIPPIATLATQLAASDEYFINPEDVLDVYIYDVPELSREYMVNAAGKVTVPLLPSPVQAAGLTTEQFARALEQTFRETGRLNRPQITVAIKQSRRSALTVDGAVKLPQVVPVMGRTSLLSVISQCGGLADDAGSTVTITRGALASKGSTSSRLTVELKKLMENNDPASQIDVYPGDRISVERAGVFYVMGEVNRPGGYNLKSAQEQVTVLEALSIAGDVTSVAKKNQAKIIRKDATTPTGRREVAINVKDILGGRSPDQVLQANDILYVPASGGKRALHTFTSTTTTVAGAAGGAVVYRR